MTRCIHAFIAAALVFFTAACESSFQVEEQHLFLRYVAKDDTLLMLEVEHGITGSPAKAVGAIQIALEGRRIYPPEGGFIHFDLDEVDEAVAPEQKESEADFREFARHVKVAETCVFIDEDGRLSLLRLTRIEKFQRVVEVLNRTINRDMKPDEPFRPKFPIFDAETSKLVRAAVTGGHPWLRIEGEMIVLDVPMSQTNAAACLGSIAKRARDDPSSSDGDWLNQVSSLEVGKHNTLLRFGEEPKQVLRFSWTSAQEPDGSAGILALLGERKIEIGDASTLTLVRARLEPLPSVLPK